MADRDNQENPEFSSSREAFRYLRKRPRIVTVVMATLVGSAVGRHISSYGFSLQNFGELLFILVASFMAFSVMLFLGIILGPLWDCLLRRHKFVKPEAASKQYHQSIDGGKDEIY